MNIQPTTPRPALPDFVGVPFSLGQQKIIDALASVYPRRLHKDALVDAVYADDPNGGPDYALESVRVQIFHIRKKLKGSGWTIPNNKVGDGSGNYCFYSLAPTAAPTAA